MGAVCEGCGRDMVESPGCTVAAYDDFIDGTTRERIPYGRERHFGEGFAPADRCHDCGTTPGNLHHPGCDMEECPGCGRQAITCDCVERG